MPPIYASTLHRRDRAWGVRRRHAARVRALALASMLLLAGAGTLVERLIG